MPPASPGLSATADPAAAADAATVAELAAEGTAAADAMGAAPPLEEPLSHAKSASPARRRSPETPPWFHRM
jgi:hypothetical protein